MTPSVDRNCTTMSCGTRKQVFLRRFVDGLPRLKLTRVWLIEVSLVAGQTYTFAWQQRKPVGWWWLWRGGQKKFNYIRCRPHRHLWYYPPISQQSPVSELWYLDKSRWWCQFHFLEAFDRSVFPSQWARTCDSRLRCHHWQVVEISDTGVKKPNGCPCHFSK